MLDRVLEIPHVSVQIETGKDNFKQNTELLFKAEEYTFFGKKWLMEGGEPAELVKIHEFSTIRLTVISQEELGDLVLVIGSKLIKYHNLIRDNGNLVYYFYDEKPFYNHLGYTNICIDFVEKDFPQVSIPVEIYSSKATFEDAREMLGFIQEVDPKIASLCFSQTRLDSSLKESKEIDLLTKINLGERVIEFLDKNIKLFLKYPAVIFSRRKEKVSYKTGEHHIDENGIRWLTENSKELSIDLNDTHAYIDWVPVKIANIEIDQPFYDSDTFENQVIHSFLSGFQIFLKKIVSLRPQCVERFFDSDVYSFSQLKHDWARGETGPQLKAKTLLKKVVLIKRFLDKNLPVSSTKKVLPRLTNEVKSKRHYSLVFKKIEEFYRVGEPDWSESSVLSGIKNLAKIYEIFVLINLLGSINRVGLSLRAVSYIDYESFSENAKPQGEINNVYKFEDGNQQEVTLFYEPKIVPYSFEKSNILGSVHKATVSIKEFGIGFLTPDYLLISQNGFLIFDAKFSKKNVVNQYSIPSLMNKYGIGIQRRIRGKDVSANGVIAIYAKDTGISKTGRFESLYSKGVESMSLGMSGKLCIPPKRDVSDSLEGVYGLIRSIL